LILDEFRRENHLNWSSNGGDTKYLVSRGRFRLFWKVQGVDLASFWVRPAGKTNLGQGKIRPARPSTRAREGRLTGPRGREFGPRPGPAHAGGGGLTARCGVHVLVTGRGGTALGEEDGAGSARANRCAAVRETSPAVLTAGGGSGDETLTASTRMRGRR